MSFNYRYVTVFFSIVLLVTLSMWYNSAHDDEQFRGQTQLNTINQMAVDQVLAEDLSLTTSLFIEQLKNQLLRWSTENITDQDLHEKFQDQLIEHQHFEGFAIVNNGKLEKAAGSLNENDLEKLTQSYNGIKSSNPYMKNGNEYMLMSCETEDGREVVGEVDLSFVKKYVRDIANVADANGNFFIGNGDTDVEFEGEGIHKGKAKANVDELGWQIVLRSSSNEQEAPAYKEHEIVISFIQGVDGKEWIEQTNLTLVKNGGPYYIVRDDTRSTEELVQELSNHEAIETVEPNYHYTKQNRDGDNVSTIPNDEFYEPYQWNLTQIFAEIGWDISSGAKDVPIAILDSGVDPTHDDLKDRILKGYNAFKDDGEFKDEHGHGTHVAGIAAAATNNYIGIAGVSWSNPILPVKVLNENAEGTSFEIANGIRWATDNGAKVINMSLGDTYNSKIMYDAIRYAYKNDVVLIAAAGNDNVATPMYPAAYKEVLAVSAVDHQRQKAIFSNYGDHIDVTAPGEHIPSTYLDNNYVMMSGTSMAAPHVAGLAGLIRSINPQLTNDEVLEIIRTSANDIGPRGYDPYYGHGEINIVKALKQLQAKK